MWIFLNDAFVPQEEAKISVFDHGFLYGDGVYESLRVYDGQVLLLERHLARLRQSCDFIGLKFPIPENKWPALLQELLRRNGLTNASVRISLSRGEGAIGLDASLCPRPTIVMIARPFAPYPESLFTNGVRLELVSIRRNPLSAQSPRIKSLSFLNNILAKQEATRAGSFDALMLNMEGYISECTVSNVFFVKEEQLFTPSVDCGILEGVTREIVLSLSQEQRIPAHEGHYGPHELLEADECFITNTSMEVMPVSQVGEQSIGKVCPGPLTKRLRQLFQKNVNRFLSPLPQERNSVKEGSNSGYPA